MKRRNTPAHDMQGNVVSLITEYGFDYGCAKVERVCHFDDGSVELSVTTPRQTLKIYVTPTGLIRVPGGARTASRV